MSPTPYPCVPVRPAVFDSAGSRWVDAKACAPPGSQDPGTFSVATWNVWFGDVDRTPRGDALLSVLEGLRPDVVCFQEVVPRFLKLVLAAPWIRAGYTVSDATGETLGDYGVVMLSRAPFRALHLQELPTNMGRKLLFGDVETPLGPLRVATMHLESTRWNTHARVEQLHVLQPVLLHDSSDVVLAGDFNFDPARHPDERAATDPRFQDAWTTAHSGAPGYTIDTDANAMCAALGGGAHTRQRIDRILVASPRAPWTVTDAQMLGNAPIAAHKPAVFPSDHFGLFARFTRR